MQIQFCKKLYNVSFLLALKKKQHKSPLSPKKSDKKVIFLKVIIGPLKIYLNVSLQLLVNYLIFHLNYVLNNSQILTFFWCVIHACNLRQDLLCGLCGADKELRFGDFCWQFNMVIPLTRYDIILETTTVPDGNNTSANPVCNIN